MAPVYAVPRLLARNGLSLQDFDYYEIHEAFAAQVRGGGRALISICTAGGMGVVAILER